jgi:hypothetical protein
LKKDHQLNYKPFIAKLIIFFLLFSNCEVKKNPLAPNGPFGIFTLYYNLSKIGAWNYSSLNPLYKKDANITQNVPRLGQPLAIVTDYSTRDILPNGLILNPNSGIISGIPTEEVLNKQITVFANNLFFREQFPTSVKVSVVNFSYEPSYNLNTFQVVNINPTFSSGFNKSDFQYSITPALPTGFSFNQTNGAITGSRQTTFPITSYTVKAVNSNKQEITTNFTFSFMEWTNEAYVKAPNSNELDYFGNSVAISGDTIVVGARIESSNQTTITNGTTASSDNSAYEAGAAYVFRRTGNNWVNEAYLKAPNAEENDFFGYSVSISGDTIVVGAVAEDSNQTTITNGTITVNGTGADDSGSAYVFRRTGNTWTNEAYLKAPNAEGGDSFGVSVTISGDTIVVGATGEASNQTTITNGNTTSGNNSSTISGAAYVFRRTGNIWTNEAYLKAPNADADDFFGSSVSISGDTIAVGSPNEDSNQTTITNGTTASSDNSSSDSGAVYVFKRNRTTWTNEAYLKAPNAGPWDWFGYSISISGDTVVVGAHREASTQTTITNGSTASSNNLAIYTGAAYIFRRTDSTWISEAYIKAPNSDYNDHFGYSVNISGERIVVGAILESSSQTTITNGTLSSLNNFATDSGAAYVFRRTGSIWENEAFLKAPNAEGGDKFGYSVSISGDTIVVGAIDDGSNQTTITNGSLFIDNNDAIGSGAAYVFRRK